MHAKPMPRNPPVRPAPLRHFVKNPELGDVSIPEFGVLKEGMVLVGETFAKYAPQLLVEVPHAPSGVPLESREPQRGPVLLTEPAPVGAHTQEQLEEDDAAPVKRGRGRPRKYPLAG